MTPIGKWIFFAGLALAAVGLVLWLTGGRGWLDWVGRLPGDIRIEKEGSRFYFPVVTCIVISILASLLLAVLRRFWP
ncbi:MAG: DUF2905 domain-containing protein [Verrucomicrobiales bacterium]